MDFVLIIHGEALYGRRFLFKRRQMKDRINFSFSYILIQLFLIALAAVFTLIKMFQQKKDVLLINCEYRSIYLS